MLIAFAFVDDAKLFVVIGSPGVKDLLTEVHDLFLISTRNADGVRIIVDFGDFCALFTSEYDFFVFGSEKRKDWRTTLEMFVVKDRATDDWKVAVAAHEIGWELFDEGKKPVECLPFDFHRNMVFFEGDAMVTEISVW